MARRPPNARAKQAQASRATTNRAVDLRRGSAASRGYDARWDRARRAHLTSSPLCRYCETASQPRITPATLVDHLYPHRGDMDLFWTQLWWVSSCSTCHNGFKQKVEAEGGQALDALAVRLGLPPRGGRASVQRSGPSPSGSGGMARPTWFRRAQIPLTLVAGPPGAGKSTYVRQRAGHHDRVICFDEIATNIFGRAGVDRAQARLDAAGVADVLRRRNDMLADLMRKRAAGRWPAAWLILSEPIGAHRQWWADHVGARVVLLTTPAEECLRRIEADDEVGDRRGSTARVFVSTWWSQFTPADCDEVANR